MAPHGLPGDPRLRVLLIICLCLTLAAAADDGPEQLPLQATIPDFSLPGVDGRVHRLRDFATARVLVIVFTCNHCPTAQGYERRLLEWQTLYQDRSVALIAISPNDPQALRPDELAHSDLGDSLPEMRLRATQRGFTFPYLYDGETQTFSRALGARVTPHVFIFDRERRLRYCGGIDDPAGGPGERQFAQDAIDALLADRAVTLPETSAFGCSVKWSAKRDEVRHAQAAWAARPVGLRPLSVDEARQLLQDRSRPVRVVGLWDPATDEGRRLVPELVTLHRIFAGRGVQVSTVCLAQDGAGEQVAGMLTAAQASCDNYHAGTGDPTALAQACDPEWTGQRAHVLVIAPGNRVIHRASGAVDPPAIRCAIIGVLDEGL